MSVELIPEELGFRRPFDHEVTQVLSIGNKNSTPVAFKVKTTAPKQYCVRPNSGVVKPNSSVEVQVLLQAMKEDPPLDARCRDKFLVQSVLVNADDDDSNAANIWAHVEKTAKSSILEKKIRVSFLPAGGAATNGVVHTEEAVPSSPPPPAYGSPAAPQRSVPPTETSKGFIAQAAETSGLTSAAATISNAMPTSQDGLKAQLDAAQQKIAQLTDQVSDPQARQRKVAEAQDKVQTVVQQTNETGVPLQIVAALCLLSFLIAWIFF